MQRGNLFCSALHNLDNGDPTDNIEQSIMADGFPCVGVTAINQRCTHEKTAITNVHLNDAWRVPSDLEGWQNKENTKY